MKKKPISALPSAMKQVLSQTPLLCLLPEDVQTAVGKALEKEVRKIITVDEVDQPDMYMGINLALEFLPVFSVFTDKAKANFARNIIDQIFPTT